MGVFYSLILLFRNFSTQQIPQLCIIVSSSCPEKLILAISASQYTVALLGVFVLPASCLQGLIKGFYVTNLVLPGL
jgi:hypothetical protein